MAKRRKHQLWDLVKEQGWTDSQEKMLRAICTIVAEATKRPSTARKPPEAVLPFGPTEVHQRLLNEASEHVSVATYDGRSFGRLGKTLQSINDLQKDDLDKLIVWLQRGGVRHWDTPPNWDHCIKHFVSWLTQARAGVISTEETGASKFV